MSSYLNNMLKVTHIVRLRSFYCLLFMMLFSPSLIAQKSTKKGIAYGHLSEADMAKISDNLSWWYNWYHQPESTVANIYQNYKMEFVPMTWGATFNETALRAYYASHPDAKYLLAFNEPNFTTQANMTPRAVAALWPKLEKIAADYNLKIVGPAVNYCDQCITVNGKPITSPVAYLDSFFVACPTCKVDYIALHNYMCYSGALSSYINDFKKFKKKIWLTEFACWDQANITLSMQKSYVLGALDYLENDTNIFRYSWFTGDRTEKYPYLDIFKTGSGELTELGKLYTSYNPVHDTSVYRRIPARIEAESYNAMNGIAVEGVTDTDGVADVGWIDAGDWLQFNVDVATTGTYYVFFRIASNANTSLTIRENGTTLATLEVPSSGGWQNWRTLNIPLTLSQGKHKLQVYTATGQFNLNWLAFSDNQSTIPTSVRIKEKSEASIYPNPVTEKLFIETDNTASEKTVSIINQTGKVLVTKKFDTEATLLEIDFSAIRSGAYILVVTDNIGTSSQLVIK